MKPTRAAMRRKYTRVVDRGEHGHEVQLVVGIQSFILDTVTPRTKAEADWFAKMLGAAIANIVAAEGGGR